MKNYNQNIEIKVAVSNIAANLLSTINEDFPHAEKVVETIIDNLLTTPCGISQLYNSLAGYSNDINFTIGQKVYCNEDYYGYVAGQDGKSYVTIANCVIKSIDLARTNKVKVEFDKRKSNGEYEKSTKWVYHTNLSEVVKVASVEVELPQNH